jgi:ribosomal protein L35
MKGTKTNKSFSKRIKVSRNGKARIRKPGKNHFNARSNRVSLLKKKGLEECHIDSRTLSQYLPSESNL